MTTTAKTRTARERNVWNAGFAIACVELATTHMQGDLAAMLFRDAGLSLAMCREAGMDDTDLKQIEIFLKNN